MTTPTARVLALLEILQSGGFWTVRDLAERLDVDERTVRRYVTHLTDLDVPVRSQRGRYGGYQLAPGFRLPPLMFTDDEAVAVLFGLVTARRTAPGNGSRRVDRQCDGETAPGTAGALGSAARYAAGSGRLHRSHAEHVHRHRSRRRCCTVPAAVRRGRRSAATGGVGLHRPARSTQRTDREPLRARGALRALVRRRCRLHRREGAQLPPRPDHRPDAATGSLRHSRDFDAGRHVVDGLADTPRTHTVSVRVHASTEQVGARVPVGLAIIEETSEPGWVRMRLHAERLDWIPALLAGLGQPFIVEQPSALRDQIRALARRLEQFAGQTDGSTRDTHSESDPHTDRR